MKVMVGKSIAVMRHGRRRKVARPIEGGVLASEDLLDFADLLLGFAFDFLRFAFGLQAGISHGLAGDFLDFTGDRFGEASCLVLGARFHFVGLIYF